MFDSKSAIAVPRTIQEVAEAVRIFKSRDWSGEELYERWQAIRSATLNLSDLELDRVSGGDSY
ncbi:MAG: hypothetical protein LH631_05040 [Alkalinema sp. CAN_BIN05]|nr:hypothetical protein [Alkalinema sp. CAN_BIN05]